MNKFFPTRILRVVLSSMLCVAFAPYIPLVAQVEGLWLVESVSMGDQPMTPVAKWTRIDTDHTYTSGNGWLQNSAGSWTYDAASSAFLPVETNGTEDPFGAFTVSFEDDVMVWQREEEGALVTVRWVPIDDLPRSHTDRVVGRWSQAKGEAMRIRWDRIVVIDPQGERRLGYWLMNAHRPLLELIPLDDYAAHTRWAVTFDGENSMTWTGNGPDNEGEVKVFVREQGL